MYTQISDSRRVYCRLHTERKMAVSGLWVRIKQLTKTQRKHHLVSQPTINERGIVLFAYVVYGFRNIFVFNFSCGKNRLLGKPPEAKNIMAKKPNKKNCVLEKSSFFKSNWSTSTACHSFRSRLIFVCGSHPNESRGKIKWQEWSRNSWKDWYNSSALKTVRISDLPKVNTWRHIHDR